jgi:hypothetical protein
LQQLKQLPGDGARHLCTALLHVALCDPLMHVVLVHLRLHVLLLLLLLLLASLLQVTSEMAQVMAYWCSTV